VDINMARFDDFLQGSIYSRPAQMMNTINQYTNANAAVLPVNTGTSGTSGTAGFGTATFSGVTSKPPPPEFTPYGTSTVSYGGDGSTSDGIDPRGPDIVGSNMNNLAQIFGDLGIDATQQKNLLDFTGITGGDQTQGISSEEWAQFFGLPGDYAGRFAGFSNLEDLSSEVSGISERASTSSMAEVQAAQSAQIQGQRRGGLVGGNNSMQRRNLMSTLNQRRESIQEGAEGEYAKILEGLRRTLREGFGISGNVLQDNPDVMNNAQMNLRTAKLQAEGYLSGGGKDPFWNIMNNSAYEDLLGAQRTEFENWWRQQLQLG
tara:strand:+ start:148 stop:1101 length:954 start_codon:yes stop_codon:yes gene_type:complete